MLEHATGTGKIAVSTEFTDLFLVAFNLSSTVFAFSRSEAPGQSRATFQVRCVLLKEQEEFRRLKSTS